MSAFETVEEFIDGLQGELGPRQQATALTEAIDGEHGEELQGQVIVAAVNGSYGAEFEQEGWEVAEEIGFELVEQEEEDPEQQEQLAAAELQEAEGRQVAWLAAEEDRLQQRFGPLSDAEREKLIAAIPGSALDGEDLPDLAETFSPQLQEMRNWQGHSAAQEEGRIDAGARVARELVAQRNTEEADNSGRTRTEQRLHGDDSEPEPGSDEDRLERSVNTAWAMLASDDELDQAEAEGHVPDASLHEEGE